MRLATWHRRLVLTVLMLVAVSGALWFVLHDIVGTEPGEVLRTLLVAHGVTAFASAVAFGSVLPLHVAAGYRRPQNRVSGLGCVAIMVVLIGTALLLYYGGEETHESARLIHLVVGFAATIIVAMHVVRGRRLRTGRAPAD